MLLSDLPLLVLLACSKRFTSFIQSEVAKYQQPATNPERLCYQLWGVNPQQLLFNSEAKTVVDFAVLMDPYTEYFRAVSAPL